MEMEDRKVTAWSVIGSIANTIVQMLIGINIYIIYYFTIRYLAGEFQLHIIFSATGYQLLMMEAIMAFDKNNIWGSVLSRQNKKIAHLVLQILGAICVLVGFSLIVSIVQVEHFSTAHGICGLIGFICSMISLINGTVTYFAPRLANIRATPVKALHTLCGSVAIIMGLVTLSIGVNKLVFTVIMGKNVAICVTVFIALTLVYVLINPMVNFVRYLKNMKTTSL